MSAGAEFGEAVGVCWAKTKRAAQRRRKQKVVRFDIQRIVLDRPNVAAEIASVEFDLIDCVVGSPFGSH